MNLHRARQHAINKAREHARDLQEDLSKLLSALDEAAEECRADENASGADVEQAGCILFDAWDTFNTTRSLFDRAIVSTVSFAGVEPWMR